MTKAWGVRAAGAALVLPALTAITALTALAVAPPIAATTAAPGTMTAAPPATATTTVNAVASGVVTGSVPETWPVATLAPKVMTARPGFRRTRSGTVLDVMRFTTVAGFALPATTRARAVLLTASVSVTVPTRLALSVRAWCDPAAIRPSPEGPVGTSLRDVLVIGQNPVPGSGRLEVAARSLAGRSVVVVPASTVLRCTMQLSPRTETTVASTIRVRGGSFSAAPVTLLAKAAQRPALLVGSPGAPGWPSSAGRPVAVRAVAPLATTTAAGAVRLEGEAELTTCAFGYHACGRGTRAPSVVDVRLVLADVTAGSRVCKIWTGTVRRVTITPAVHHLKVWAKAVTLTAARRCGTAVRGYLEVRHRSGNAVEIEPTLALPGGAVRVQTHDWLARA